MARKTLGTLALLASLAIAMLGCGKKDNPVAPVPRVPSSWAGEWHVTLVLESCAAADSTSFDRTLTLCSGKPLSEELAGLAYLAQCTSPDITQTDVGVGFTCTSTATDTCGAVQESVRTTSRLDVIIDAPANTLRGAGEVSETFPAGSQCTTRCIARLRLRGVRTSTSQQGCTISH